ncbi:MAG: hypothetical protein JRL30_17690 [Deltaproteobacteria bacterium]|nr:hypothetical protein [Deltaproteobacteria bacterium]
MKSVRTVLLLVVLLGLSGCLIYFVDQPASTISGTTIEITVNVDPPSSSTTTIPVVGIAIPDAWGVSSVTYLWEIGGGLSGTGVFDPETSDYMNTEYPTEGYLWRCYRGPEAEFPDDAYGHMYFTVDMPSQSSGTYALRYSYGELDDEPGFSMVDRTIVVDAAANYLNDWHNSSSQGQFANLFAATHGNGIFVAAGSDGEIATSSDGTTWTKQTSGSEKDINSMVFGDGSFVAVGSSGEILTSPDGIAWTKRGSGTEKDLECVSYDNALFVAAGRDGEIRTSSDGITWTRRSSGTEEDLLGLAYGNRVFVAVGGSGQILTSPDGVTWSATSSGTDSGLFSVTYGNNRFVAVGSSGEILTSSNGETWTMQRSGTENTLLGIGYTDEGFVIVGTDGQILSSADGETWTQRSSGTSLDLHDMAYQYGCLVVVGEAWADYSNGIILRATPPSQGGSGSGSCFISAAGAD